jgi:hypothetical protein
MEDFQFLANSSSHNGTTPSVIPHMDGEATAVLVFFRFVHCGFGIGILFFIVGLLYCCCKKCKKGSLNLK